MSRVIMGIVITVVAGSILAATAWNFNAVASMPERYVTKEDNSKEHKEINDKLDKIMDYLIRRGG